MAHPVRAALPLAALLLTACVQDNPAARPPGADATPPAGGAGGGAGGGPGGAGGGPGGAGGGGDCQGGLQAEPPSLQFDRDGTSGLRILPVTLRNTSDCSIQLTGLRADGSPRFSPRLDGEDPRRRPALWEDPDQDGDRGLAPGAHFTLQIHFQNDDLEPQTGALIIDTEAGQTLTLPLRGDLDGPCLRLDPGGLSFDPLPVGSGDARELQLSPCGTTPVTVTALDLDDSPPEFSLADAPGVPLTLRPGGGPPARLRLRFRPLSDGNFQGSLRVDSDDPRQPQATIRLLGQARPVRCPRAFAAPIEDAIPLGVPISLDASLSAGDAPIVRYDWLVLERPDGSAAPVLEALTDPQDPSEGGPADDPATPTATFVPDLPGTYRLALRITDASGLSSEGCGGDLQLPLIIGQGRNSQLWIELSWRRPNGQPGGDLDLALLHPNAAIPPVAPWICHAADPGPDWGQPETRVDDPLLLEDITDGSRPEQIQLPILEDTAALGGPYRIWVRRLAAPGDAGPVDATLHIFSRGIRVSEITQRILAPGDTWRAARLTWPALEIRPDSD